MHPTYKLTTPNDICEDKINKKDKIMKYGGRYFHLTNKQLNAALPAVSPLCYRILFAFERVKFLTLIQRLSYKIAFVKQPTVLTPKQNLPSL